jgi:hypothetical protein
MHALYIILFCTIYLKANAQHPFRENIETDTSNIEIIRNSVYKVYEETYKNKDLIWYSVDFIKDTTKFHTEGWKKKNGTYLGVWEEYNFEGDWMFTRDYDKGLCKVNEEKYPYHDILKKMKLKADTLIMKTYSKSFFKNHVKFNFEGSGYKLILIDIVEKPYWAGSYVGSWTEPMKSKPNQFKFRYQVRLSPKDNHFVELGMELDSVGNYIPSSDDRWRSYGFEKLESKNRNFQINENKALEIAKKQGLIICDTTQIFQFLTWENFKQKQFYNGQFRYYISESAGKIEYSKGENRKGIIFKYNIYSFNPWSGEFIEKKKMKTKREWGPHSGHSTGLILDK